MRERLVTLALAVGALVLFIAFFVPRPPPELERITDPLSAERGPNGYWAARRWLEREGVRVVELRERYDKLANVARAETGNLLITVMPHKLTARSVELERLRNWIEQGNTVLVMAALADTPDWTFSQSHGDLIKGLRALTGIEFESFANQADEQTPSDSRSRAAQVAEAMQKLLQPEERSFEPNGAHPLLDGVRSVGAVSEFPADSWRAQPIEMSALLEIAIEDTEKHAPAFWLANMGEGQIIVSGFASSFANKAIGKRDNARLLANIVNWSLTKEGAVIFDDAHQGAVAFYDPQAFFGDPRLHRALWWLLIVWLVFVVGASRLRATRIEWQPVDIMSFVRATGGFMARALADREATRRQFALFFNDIRRRLGLPENGAPLWEWLESQATLSAKDIGELRRDYERAQAGRRVDFARVHSRIQQIRGSFV